MITTSEMERRADAALDAVQEGRVADVLAMFGPSGRLELPNRPGGHPTTIDGNSLRSFLELFARLFPSVRLTDRRYHRVEGADVLVAEYRSEGESRTGRPYRNRYVAFFEMHDDGIACWREYFDPTAIDEALRP